MWHSLPGPTRQRPAVGVARAIAQAAVSRTIRVLLAGGAVVAVAELLRDLAPGPALAGLVALTTMAHAAVAVWTAMTGPIRVEQLARGGAWVTCALVLGTMALTSWILFGQLLAVLAALALVRLRLDRD